MRVSIVACLSVALVCLAGSGSWGGEEFDRIDTNTDKKIDLKEFLDAAGKTFDAVDKNKDGYLDKNELNALLQPGGDSLEGLDANRDGKIDRHEFLNGATGRFHEFDTGQDGYIDPPEFDRKGGPSVYPFIILRF
jgi:Ca2+-binding EF-hand superfamily protein